MNIDNLMSLMFGVLIGANIGFIIAGLMGRADDGEEMSD
jgi:gas vesicle protein